MPCSLPSPCCGTMRHVACCSNPPSPAVREPKLVSMRRIAILGSTGSIGRSTLNVAESYPERFQIVSLAAGRNLDAAAAQALRWKPRVVSVAAERDAEILRSQLKSAGIGDIEIVHGSAGSVRVATHP